MVSIKNPCFYWLDKNTFILAFDGEFDEDGDDYSYQVKYQKDKGLFVFSRWYECDITPAGFSKEEEEYIKSIMCKEIALNPQAGQEAGRPIQIQEKCFMEKSEFERQINSLVPCPDQKTTTDLFSLGQELGEEIGYSNPQDILNSLSFISRHFDPEVTQGVYEIIQFGSALPDEMVAAAVHMASCGCSPRQMAQAANDGELMCFHTPKDAEELSPLAVCTVCENGQALTRYTTHFGGFDPEAALLSAQEYAHDRKITVTDALLSLTVDLELNPNGGARKILARSDEAMTEMLDSCFDRYPVLAARLTFDADRSQTAVEYNPLWLELRQQQEPAQAGMEQTIQ